MAQVPSLSQRWRTQLRQLPREARDTLFLLVIIGLTLAPHALHLAPWCVALSMGVLLWRARMAITGGALPPRWAVTGLLLLAAGLTLWSERSMLGREAGITMLVALMALKTLELRAKRDALVVFFLGFFLVLTQFLYSQSLLTGLWMLVAVWGLLAALVLANMPVGRPALPYVGAIAARSTAWGLPLMVLLFLLFPRMGPLWGLPQDAGGRTGLSGSMSLGRMAQIAEDDAIALRLRFEGPAPPTSQVYLRGPVLTQFDGRDWTRLVPSVPAAQRARAELAPQGPALRYEITLEPSKLALLPLLEATPDAASIHPQMPGWLLTLRPDLQWQTDRPVAERVRLSLVAHLDHQHGPKTPVPGLVDYLQLPPSFNPRMAQWAEQFINERNLRHASTQARVQAVLAYIRQAEFGYTLEPGTYGRDAIDEFWLDRKLGFCEHFSSAFVVAMRWMGVPSRIVTGYQGMDPQPQDGWWIVRQRNAHAWVEVWEPGKGWVRVDPTAAVAPERVQLGRSLAPKPNLLVQTLDGLNPGLVVQLKLGWENFNNRWNQWVLNYSRAQQFDLLKSLGFAAPSWADLASVLLGLLCTAAAGGALWAWWDRRRQDPWVRLMQRVQRRLLQLGVPVARHHPLHTQAALVRAALGPTGLALASALDELAQRRYGNALATQAPQSDSQPTKRLRANAARVQRNAWRRQFERAALQARMAKPQAAAGGAS